MLKILLATIMLAPTATLMNMKHLLTTTTVYSITITFLMLKWLAQPLNQKPHMINTLMALDNITTPLVIMSSWILPLMIMASQHHLNKEPATRKRTFITTCAILQTTLILTFTTTNQIMFYIMFEATLIPTLILITRWGNQPARLIAGTYFLFYTLTGSLPLLIVILLFYNTHDHSIMSTIMYPTPTGPPSMVTWLAYMSAFMVKMPLYGLHLWLPKAHVEAPIAGSMVLAAILLKLGGYGMIRMAPMTLPTTQIMYFPFIVLSLWGMIMTSLICLRQTDLKSIIAYSSVSHMGLVISANLIETPWSIAGAMLLMIAHGLTSSMLFCLANTNYERTHTRTLLLTRGLLFALPMMMTWWLLASIANMALPPTINLLGELTTITALFNWSTMTIILTATTTLITATYTLYIFMYSQRSTLPPYMTMLPTYTREHLLMALHLIPLMLLITSPNLMF